MSTFRGVILHPTSLANDRAAGALGPESRELLDWMAKAGLHIWQTLPTNPAAPNNSPYDAPSTFALSTALISIDDLITEGWLPKNQDPIATPKAEHRARMRAAANVVDKVDLAPFHDKHAWLLDWALFAVLTAEYGRDWTQWPPLFRDRDAESLDTLARTHANEVDLQVALQWLAEGAWDRFRKEAKKRQIQIWGDLPIYVSRYSCDVWCNRDLFLLHEDGTPALLSGVPPDDFSRDGQLWGHPIYNVPAHIAENYQWWLARVTHLTQQVDRFRLDHFRGLVSMWAVPPAETTAANGRWLVGLGQGLLDRLGDLPLYAEDLGFITPEVAKLRDNNGFAGMAVLQFGFNTTDSPHHPNHHLENQVLVTGTHDNDTSSNWLRQQGIRAWTRLKMALHTAGIANKSRTLSFVSLAFNGKTNWALVPMQDLLELPKSARMNMPGVEEGNWTWRMQPDALTDEFAVLVRDL